MNLLYSADATELGLSLNSRLGSVVNEDVIRSKHSISYFQKDYLTIVLEINKPNIWLSDRLIQDARKQLDLCLLAILSSSRFNAFTTEKREILVLTGLIKLFKWHAELLVLTQT